MDKQVLVSLSTRLAQVQQRKEALELERIQLIQEEEHLAPLIELYSKLDYDSIEEERRVTYALNQKPLATKKIAKKGTSKYDVAFEIIFSTKPDEAISFTNIHKQVETLFGQKLNPGTVCTAVKTAVHYGKLTKVAKGSYKWTGGNQ